MADVLSEDVGELEPHALFSLLELVMDLIDCWQKVSAAQAGCGLARPMVAEPDVRARRMRTFTSCVEMAVCRTPAPELPLSALAQTS